jgi:muramoyltetrapeptide carboxypeptidase
MRIAVVAPSCSLNPKVADAVQRVVAARRDCELVIHPQCFLKHGHFAGPDSARLEAFREVLGDENVDAVWCARGGYGSNRIAPDLIRDLPPGALDKPVMGYSDAGFMLGGLYNAGVEVAWGPMLSDIVRPGGEAPIHRALNWFLYRDASSVEADLQPPAMAFNLTVLSAMLGTPLEPDLTGVDLLIEDVAEQLYRIDRAMFHVSSSANLRRVARIRLGRVAGIIPNDPEFAIDELAIVEEWCARSGIRYGGRADIGHDADNKVVPFGRASL